MKEKEVPVRKNKPCGIRWRGYLYESHPPFGDEYVAVVEDGGDYLMIQPYSRADYWKPFVMRLVGEPQRVVKIGMGRPTDWRINKLKEALCPRFVAANVAARRLSTGTPARASCASFDGCY